jgi:DNA uptake protein ComE-like DNA-binding protein
MSRIRMNHVVLGALAATLAIAPAAFAADPAPASAPAKTATKTASTKTHHATHKAMARVDINSASKEDLMKLPGVDDATADKIIAARPFTSRSELVSKNILTKAQYAKLSSKITAKQSSSTMSK